MTQPMDLGIGIELLWAKSPAPDFGQVEGYPLLPHLLDVAAVGSALLAAVPCPVDLPMSNAWIAALVGLHDLGKASPGFQCKLGRQAIGDRTLERDQPDRHDISTVQILADLLKAKEVNHRVAADLAHAVGAHHGSSFTAAELHKRWEITEDWQAAHKALLEGVLAGVGATRIPALPNDAAERSVALQWLMGLTTTADWLGSSEALCRWERLPTGPLMPQEWFAQSLTLAHEAVRLADLAPSSLPTPTNGANAVRRVLGADRDPRPLQQAIAAVIDRLPQGPSLIVLEAPMGEGKTEAALSCALGTRGIYLAMPTQATSNALFQRLKDFLEANPTTLQAHRPIALAHSSGGPDAVALKLREIGIGSNDSAVTAGWWFRGSKRTLLCPHGIGTVDQALVGVLQCRHSFLRLYGLTGRTVIFDEVHAYDSYTGGLIERLIGWLRGLGCRVVVMTATLPAERRQALLKAWQGEQEPSGDALEPPLPTVAYPRLTWIGFNGPEAVSFTASRRQRLVFCDHPSEADVIASQATKWAEQGVRVLVVVNKVARAQEIFQKLGSVPATLFHARFPMEQRLEIERLVLSNFGPSGVARNGHVLVATQVAEQSLDIDFDVLITDPAPVDLLLQRQGRIHRHRRDRPAGFADPLVFVAGLSQILPAEELTRFIYDRWLVLRSCAWLRGNSTLELPVDIDRAVQAVYGTWQPEGPEELTAALATSWLDHQQGLASMRSAASQVALDTPEDWRLSSRSKPTEDDDAAEAGRVRFGTRLGEDSQTVVPVFPADLADWQGRRHLLTRRHLRIGDRRLIQLVRSATLPPGWRETPGLGFHCPLFLDAAGEVLGAPMPARLDPVLGLVAGGAE